MDEKPHALMCKPPRFGQAMKKRFLDGLTFDDLDGNKRRITDFKAGQLLCLSDGEYNRIVFRLSQEDLDKFRF